MEFEGTVFKIMPATSGTSARGEWHRQDVVFEMMDGAYARKVCTTFFNKKSDVERIKEGETYIVSVNLESREYNGKWYNDIRAWRIQPKQSEVEQPVAAASAYNAPPMPPVPAEPSYAASSAAEDVDDLPF